jgi:hypothetical protein
MCSIECIILKVHTKFGTRSRSLLGLPPSYRAEGTKDEEVDQPPERPHKWIGPFGPNRRASKMKLSQRVGETKSTPGFLSNQATDDEMKP